jgi:hypothetical protein
MANFHTLPRTLGGKPFHHKSWAFFDPLLEKTENDELEFY